MRFAICTLLSAALMTGCAATIPPDSTFNTGAWSAVEAIAPGARVEVGYVTGAPPLRHSFEGTFVRATSDALEIRTKAGLQRLLPHRVTKVTVGGRESRMAAFASFGLGAGAILGALSIVDPPNDDVLKRHTITGAIIGGALGAWLGARRGDARPVVVYVRSGSL